MEYLAIRIKKEDVCKLLEDKILFYGVEEIKCNYCLEHTDVQVEIQIDED